MKSYCFNFITKDENLFYCLQGETCPKALKKLCFISIDEDNFIGESAVGICAEEYYYPSECVCADIKNIKDDTARFGWRSVHEEGCLCIPSI